MQVDPVYYYACEWEARKKNIQKIYDAINFKSDVMLTAHGFCIMSCKVLADLKKNFMDVNGYSYKDLLKICGYEFSWYNLWLQKSKVIPLYIREPLFKCFHTFDQLLWYKLQGITVGDIARGYVGIVVNSNFQPNRGQDNPLDYNSTEIPDFFKSRLPKFLLREPTGKECVKILLKKIRQKLKKILHF